MAPRYAFAGRSLEHASNLTFDAFNLSVEAVAALEPDLVVLAYDPGDAVAGLTALGIPTILFAPPGPVTLDEVYDEWRDLGAATGNGESADLLVDQVRREVGDVVDEISASIGDSTYYVELDPLLYTAGRGSLLDSIFGMLGLTSIVGEDAGPFPQLSSEAVIAADPDFVFLADTVCCSQSAETVASRPGWDRLTAVLNGAVVELDDSIASRWSHRILDLIITIADEVYGAG